LLCFVVSGQVWGVPESWAASLSVPVTAVLVLRRKLQRHGGQQQLREQQHQVRTAFAAKMVQGLRFESSGEFTSNIDKKTTILIDLFKDALTI
jgi:hypothetical protein